MDGRWGGGDGFRYPPESLGSAINQISSPMAPRHQVQPYNEGDVYEPFFLHAYAIGPITIPQQSPSLCTNLYIRVSQDYESAIDKSRPDKIYS